MTDELELALRVPCPSCAAGELERCVRPDGEPARATHKRRAKAAAKADADRKARAEREVPETIKGTRWKRLYRNCRLELEQRGDWTKLASTQLESMVRMLLEAENLLDTAAAEPLVVGSQEQPVANPAWAVHARLENRALALAKTLRLTPDTRGSRAPAGGGHGSEDAEAAAAAVTAAGAEEGEVDELADLEDELATRRAAKRAG